MVLRLSHGQRSHGDALTWQHNPGVGPWVGTPDHSPKAASWPLAITHPASDDAPA
jgi:hypothetical protein